jgi:sulfite reductase (NADPH) flavoprotein alpha-component
LNGFLAAIFCRTEVSTAIPLSEAPAAKPKLNILFGSQSGNAESLAKKFAKEAEKRGFHTMVSGLDKVQPAALSNERYALFITSTWGEGDPPDNAAAFWDAIKEEKEPKLLNLGYSVLGLGDTNYQHFCGFGKGLDVRLAELGARRILDRVDCDVQFDELAAQRQKGVFESLEIIHSAGGEPPVDSFSAVVDSAKPSLPLYIEPGLDEPIPKTTPVYTRTHPFAARLLVNGQPTGPSSAKDTRHYEISLEGSGITYEVGDALGIIPQNDPDLVSEILAALGFDGEEEVSGAKGDKISIRLALSRDYQIRAPHREFLNAMAEHDDADQSLKELVRSDTRTELDKFLWGREIIDFLLESPGVKFEPAEFVGLLKNLQPRLYSIASSIKAHPAQVHLTVDTVHYESHGRTRKGARISSPSAAARRRRCRSSSKRRSISVSLKKVMCQLSW